MKAFSAGFYKKIPKNPVICKIRATILYIYNHFYRCLIKPALFRLVISLLFDVYFHSITPLFLTLFLHCYPLVLNVIFALLFYILCHMSYVLCSTPMFNVLRPTFYVLCPTFYVLCPTPYVLHSFVLSFFRSFAPSFFRFFPMPFC